MLKKLGININDFFTKYIYIFLFLSLTKQHNFQSLGLERAGTELGKSSTDHRVDVIEVDLIVDHNHDSLYCTCLWRVKL